MSRFAVAWTKFFLRSVTDFLIAAIRRCKLYSATKNNHTRNTHSFGGPRWRLRHMCIIYCVASIWRKHFCCSERFILTRAFRIVGYTTSQPTTYRKICCKQIYGLTRESAVRELWMLYSNCMDFVIVFERSDCNLNLENAIDFFSTQHLIWMRIMCGF